MSPSYSERLKANSDKVAGFMDHHGEYLESMKGVTGTVARLLHSAFKERTIEQQNDTNNRWTISAVMTKVMDAVSPKGNGLFGFFKKEEPEKDAFGLPGLQSMPAAHASRDLLAELNITSNDISEYSATKVTPSERPLSSGEILQQLNITSNDIDNVTSGEILKALNISSNPIVAQIGEDWNRSIGTPQFSPEDELNRRTQKSSLQSGIHSPLNL